MKKFLSALTVFFMVISTSIAAFGAEVPNVEEIESKIQSGAEYVASQAGTYGVSSAYSFERLVRCGAELDKYSEMFVEDVKSNLQANGGRLIVSEYDYYTDTYNEVESITYYASVIRALDEIGEDATDIDGVDLTALFLNYGADTVVDNPYMYANIIYVATFYGEENLAKAYIDKLIADYYVMGSGLNYYGYSCDNTAHFIEALGFYCYEYSQYVEDAVDVIRNYKLENGYFSDSTYGTQANANSTALALEALSIALPYCDSITEQELDEAYSMLCNFETEQNGIYDFTENTTPNAFATADAIVGLYEYFPYVLLRDAEDEPIDQPVEEEPIDKPVKEEPVDKDEPVKTSPETGALSMPLALISVAAGILILKKTR